MPKVFDPEPKAVDSPLFPVSNSGIAILSLTPLWI